MCVFVYVSVCVCVYVSVCVGLCMCACIWACMWACMCVCICKWVCAWSVSGTRCTSHLKASMYKTKGSAAATKVSAGNVCYESTETRL